MPARRLALLTTLCVMLLLLVWPVAAQAQSWKVRDRNGQTKGSVVTTGDKTADILDLSGSRPGDMWFMSSADMSGNPAFWVLRYWIGDDGNYGTHSISPVRSGRCYLTSLGGTLVGRAVRGSRWVVSKRVSGKWKRKGSLPKSCPGPYAMGAVRMLCW
jgi:hypothetical protein